MFNTDIMHISAHQADNAHHIQDSANIRHLFDLLSVNFVQVLSFFKDLKT